MWITATHQPLNLGVQRNNSLIKKYIFHYATSN